MDIEVQALTALCETKKCGMCESVKRMVDSAEAQETRVEETLGPFVVWFVTFQLSHLCIVPLALDYS